MMDPCHLLWRGIDLETQARPHAHTRQRPRADHPSRRGHLMRPRGCNPRKLNIAAAPPRGGTSNDLSEGWKREKGSLEQNPPPLTQLCLKASSDPALFS